MSSRHCSSDREEKWTYETLLSLDKSNFAYTSCYCEENTFLFIQDVINKTKESGLEIEIYAVFISNLAKTCPIWFQKSSPLPSKQPVVWDYHVISLVKVCHTNNDVKIDDDDNKKDDQLGHVNDSKKSLLLPERKTKNVNNTSWLVYDFDTILPFPVNADEYFHKAFQPSLYYNFVLNEKTGNISMNTIHLDKSKHINEEGTSGRKNDNSNCNQKRQNILSLEPSLRVVDGTILLSNFASDRSHMIKSSNQNEMIKDGELLSIEYTAPPPNYPCIQPRNRILENLQKSSSLPCGSELAGKVAIEMEMNLDEWLDMSLNESQEGDKSKGTDSERGRVMRLNEYFDFIS